MKAVIRLDLEVEGRRERLQLLLSHVLDKLAGWDEVKDVRCTIVWGSDFHDPDLEKLIIWE